MFETEINNYEIKKVRKEKKDEEKPKKKGMKDIFVSKKK
jgi:hypothetical protein